jgi:hypothetical protein
MICVWCGDGLVFGLMAIVRSGHNRQVPFDSNCVNAMMIIAIGNWIFTWLYKLGSYNVGVLSHPPTAMQYKHQQNQQQDPNYNLFQQAADPDLAVRFQPENSHLDSYGFSGAGQHFTWLGNAVVTRARIMRATRVKRSTYVTQRAYKGVYARQGWQTPSSTQWWRLEIWGLYRSKSLMRQREGVAGNDARSGSCSSLYGQVNVECEMEAVGSDSFDVSREQDMLSVDGKKILVNLLIILAWSSFYA